jgi:hypothetical protein
MPPVVLGDWLGIVQVVVLVLVVDGVGGLSEAHGLVLPG